MKKTTYFLLIFIFVLTSHHSFSQVISTDSLKRRENFTQRIKNDGHLMGKTIIEAYKRPFQWKKKEWLITGGVFAVSAVATLFDQPIYEYYNDQRGKSLFFTNVASVGDFMGQPEHNYPFMFTMWGLGIITKNEWMRDTGILLITSVTSSGLVQTALKDLVGRARPAAGKGPYHLKPFGGTSYHSFPSGHTMLALASAYVLAHQIDFMPLRIVVFAIPVITGWSRIHDGAHYLSDIVLGSALGIAFAEAVLSIYPRLKNEIRGNISLTPGANGLRLTYKF